MSFKTFFVILLLLIFGVWGYLRYQASSTQATYFNQVQRYAFGKSEFWRSVLNLNRVGDAKGQYLNDTDPTIIEVVTSRGLDINEEGLQNFASEVERITGRRTSVVNVDTISKSVINESDLTGIVKSNRRHKQFGQPNIFVIYAEDFEGSENSPSRPFYDFGILVSEKKLKELTSSYGQAIRQYLPAVMLYSFGSQIGLPENKNANCIMQQAVLRPNSALRFAGSFLPTKYCDAEIEQAKNIAESLK